MSAEKYCSSASEDRWTRCQSLAKCDECSAGPGPGFWRRCAICHVVVRLCDRCARLRTPGMFEPWHWDEDPVIVHAHGLDGRQHFYCFGLELLCRKN